ncbi:uncharacterized protein LOC119901265 isoform X2 [Micropterus salmoides]|uniref:uncharacterized protein LOC119901265 isoform X2 n=1 Tax=Micropterus salmoides TaxID=27706 RepID=UPI0018EAC6E0|nr:uncharacterized protein LOC119901265 isoform X2 [Micropterus salmoides]
MDCDRGMFCPFCGKHMSSLTQFCFTCGRCLEFLKDANQTETQGTSRQPDSAKQTEQPCPSYKQFMEYRSSKSKERQSFNYGPKGRSRLKERKNVQVFEPQNRSTPKYKLEDERDAPGQSSTIQPGQIVISDAEDLDPPETNPEKPSCYSKYTDLFSPNVEQEDEEPVAVNVTNFQHTAMEETGITLPDIVANLSLPINHKKVSRFNISRANFWDGAVRGFKRTTYSETCDMLVKFTDDTGVLEEGIDTGGPRREFLTLLMKHLKDRPIFDGPEGHRFLVYNAND